MKAPDDSVAPGRRGNSSEDGISQNLNIFERLPKELRETAEGKKAGLDNVVVLSS
jgi:hypothetical protein